MQSPRNTIHLVLQHRIPSLQLLDQFVVLVPLSLVLIFHRLKLLPEHLVFTGDFLLQVTGFSLLQV